MNLRHYITANGLTIAGVGRLVGMDRTTISKIASGEYPSWEVKAEQIIAHLKENGYNKEPVEGQFFVDDTVMVDMDNSSMVISSVESSE